MKQNSLIGPAARVDGILHLLAEETMTGAHDGLCLLLYGAPGVGKTEVANRLAATLTGGSSFAIESINGKELDLAKVKEWRQAMRYGNIFADWTVYLINEIDKASPDAQILMLTLLDELPKRRAIIATSNLQLDLLHERFQTRFTQFKVESPSYEDIERLLETRFPGLQGFEYTAIAQGSGGNVRAALKDGAAMQLAMRYALSKKDKTQEEPVPVSQEAFDYFSE